MTVARPLTGPGPAYGLNGEVLEALREGWEGRLDLTIRVSNPAGWRELQLCRGGLAEADSSLAEDGLGQLLAEQGRYDLDLLQPMLREAGSRGLRLGELMVLDGLLSLADLAVAQGQHAARVLQRQLGMPGLVTVGPGPAQAGRTQPVCALVLAHFRARLPLAEVERLLAPLQGRRLALARPASALAQLRLTPGEADFVRRLVGAETLVLGPGQPELARRLVAALSALGLVAAR